MYGKQFVENLIRNKTKKKQISIPLLIFRCFLKTARFESLRGGGGDSMMSGGQFFGNL